MLGNSLIRLLSRTSTESRLWKILVHLAKCCIARAKLLLNESTCSYYVFFLVVGRLLALRSVLFFHPHWRNPYRLLTQCWPKCMHFCKSGTPACRSPELNSQQQKTLRFGGGGRGFTNYTTEASTNSCFINLLDYSSILFLIYRIEHTSELDIGIRI